MAIGCFENEFINFRIDVFTKINDENYRKYSDDNTFYEYENAINSYSAYLKYYKESSIISKDIVELLNELKSVYESD